MSKQCKHDWESLGGFCECAEWRCRNCGETITGDSFNEALSLYEKSESSVTVCDKCLRASCWQGIFMCDNARSAGTVDKSLSELKELNLEHSHYWST